jgi:uncharacterized protein with von Willebrand factor type A (vWA) domain
VNQPIKGGEFPDQVSDYLLLITLLEELLIRWEVNTFRFLTAATLFYVSVLQQVREPIA